MLLRTMANTSMLMKSKAAHSLAASRVSPHESGLSHPMLTQPVSSPADIIWSHILSSPSTLSSFLAENHRRLTEAHAFIQGWFQDRGVPVSYSNAGNFVWVRLGAIPHVGIKGARDEKRVFQRLLDGGVYIVSRHLPSLAGPGRYPTCDGRCPAWRPHRFKPGRGWKAD